MQYSKHSKNIRDRSKIEIRRTWQYNNINKHVLYTSPDTSTCEVSSDVLRADFVYDDGIIEVSLLRV